jgi:hypothetical protein
MLPLYNGMPCTVVNTHARTRAEQTAAKNSRIIGLCSAIEYFLSANRMLSEEEPMKANGKELKRDEILELAHQAKLMIHDGDLSYLNDLATDKELLTFARLLEARHSEAPDDDEALGT